MIYWLRNNWSQLGDRWGKLSRLSEEKVNPGRGYIIEDPIFSRRAGDRKHSCFSASISGRLSEHVTVQLFHHPLQASCIIFVCVFLLQSSAFPLQLKAFPSSSTSIFHVFSMFFLSTIFDRICPIALALVFFFKKVFKCVGTHASALPYPFQRGLHLTTFSF